MSLLRIISLARGLRRLPLTGSSDIVNLVPSHISPSHRTISTSHAFQQANHDFSTPRSLAPDLAGVCQIPEGLSPAASPHSGTGFALRAHQEDAIQACQASLAAGRTRIGVSLQKGSGSTVAVLHLIRRMAASNADGSRGRFLFIVGSQAMASHVQNSARSVLGPSWRIDLEQGENVASALADVVIATRQSLRTRLKKFDPSAFTLLVVPEAHEAAAPGFRRILHYFNAGVDGTDRDHMDPVAHTVKVPIIGLSAFFFRPDRLALSLVFEEISFHRQLAMLPAEELFSPIRSLAAMCDLGLRQVGTRYGDYNPESMKSLLGTPAAIRAIAGCYSKKAADRRSTLYCVRKALVSDLRQALAEQNPSCVVEQLNPQVPEEERVTILEKFQRGEIQVLVSSELVLSGFDLPFIDCVIDAYPSKGHNLISKMLGVAERSSPDTGKKDCLFIEIVDVGVPRLAVLPNLPTLSGRSQYDRAMPDAWYDPQSMQGDPEYDPTAPISITYRDEGYRRVVERTTFLNQADPLRLLDVAGQSDMSQSRNAWVYCGKGVYILDLENKGYIMISAGVPSCTPGNVHLDPAPRYTITHLRQAHAPIKSFFGKNFEWHTVRATTMERALYKGDSIAVELMGVNFERYANWRAQPPTQKQLDDLLALIRIHKGEGQALGLDAVERSVRHETATAGHVAAYAIALTHGNR